MGRAAEAARTRLYQAILRALRSDPAALAPREVARLLAENGERVERPVLVSGDVVLVGFREDARAAAWPHVCEGLVPGLHIPRVRSRKHRGVSAELA